VPIVVIGLEISFLLLVAAFVSLGMHQTQYQWLGSLLEAMVHPRGSIFKRAALLPFAGLGQAVLWVYKHVGAILSRWTAAKLHALSRFFSAMALVYEHTYREVGALAHDVAYGFERLVTHTIPRSISAETKPLRRDLKRLGLAIGATAAALARYRHGIDRLLRERVLPGLKAAERAITVTLPHEIARVRGRVGVVERGVSDILHGRLSETARKALGLALAGTVIGVLARRLPWLFCRNVGKVGRSVCAMDSNLLESLLADALLIGGTISLVEFAKELQELTDEAAGLINDWVT
jgi:hypothetical protein